MGGLGNQMFQISTAYSYGKKWNLETKFDLKSCYTPLQGNPSIKYSDNLFKNLSVFNENDKFLGKAYRYDENNQPFREIPFFDGNVVIYGYFQNQKYFLGYDEEVKNLFTFSEESNTKVSEFLLSLDKNKTNTSIHVRRGDYLKFTNIHPTCDITYYKKAMKQFENSNFIIVSDDINWCKENFQGDNIFYPSFTNEVDDLNLLRNCDNNIIANSTFSWWGAFLNGNTTKQIIGPKTWFGKDGPKYGDDIILKNWIKI